MAHRKITREKFCKEIKRLYDAYGEINVNIFNEYSELDIHFQSYCNRFGGLKNICKELGIKHMLYNEVSKEELIKRAEKILEEHGKINKELCCKNQVSSSSVKRCFGTYTNLFKEIGYDNKFHRNVSKEDVVSDIIKFCKENGTSSTLYREKGTYSQTVIDRFGGWVNLLEELNLTPKNKKVGFEQIEKEVKEVIEEYGFISKDIITDNCSFTYQALSSYFKNKKELSNHFGYDNLFHDGRSSKEKHISTILDELIGSENYSTEKSWEWLLNETGKRMYADFYIPHKQMVIEYDGEQHFKFVEMFHKTEENFRRQQKRDMLKDKLLKENNINVVRISYNQKITKELIEEILQ